MEISLLFHKWLVGKPLGIRDYGGGTVGIDGNSGGLWGRTAILGEAVKADGK